MKSKLSAFIFASVLTGALLVGGTGCTTSANASRNAAAPTLRMPTYALAVAVRGGVEPTPAQWNAMYLKFSQALSDRGLRLINDYTKAENIINVEFLPDPLNPHLGTALISSVVPNPGLYARPPSPGRSTVDASYASYTSRGYDPIWGSNSYGYDRSNHYEYTGSNYSSPPPPTANPGPKPPVPPVPPPHPKHPADPNDCPPGTTPYQRPPSYVGHDPNRHGHGPNDGRRPPPTSDSSSTRPQSSSSGHSTSSGDSSRGSSHSSSSNASSSYSSSSSGASSSSSDSAPSYSAPAPSYSAPSYSAPSDSSSSASSSAGRDSTANKLLN